MMMMQASSQDLASDGAKKLVGGPTLNLYICQFYRRGGGGIRGVKVSKDIFSEYSTVQLVLQKHKETSVLIFVVLQLALSCFTLQY